LISDHKSWPEGYVTKIPVRGLRQMMARTWQLDNASVTLPKSP